MWRYGLVGLALVSWAAAAQAATDTAQAAVTINIAPQAVVDLVTSTNSAATSPTVIAFDTLDSADMPNGSSSFAYAPKRSILNKNWHEAKIFSNGAGMTLTANVTGTVGGQPLANVLDVFFGGFFHEQFGDQGGKSGDWELASTFTRQFNQPFSGVAPLNYRLRTSQLTGGQASGSVTYTLATTP